MRLRKDIQRPRKLLDEDAAEKVSRDSTKPLFPHLMQSRVVPFDPDLPSATFPSLSCLRGGSERFDSEAEMRKNPIDVLTDLTTQSEQCVQDNSGNYLGDYDMSDAEPLYLGSPRMDRCRSTVKPPQETGLGKNMGWSDEEGFGVQSLCNDRPVSYFPDISPCHSEPEVRSQPEHFDDILIMRFSPCRLTQPPLSGTTYAQRSSSQSSVKWQSDAL
jgi:hypothetical protein